MMNKFEIKKFKRMTYNFLLNDEIEKKIIKWSKTKKNKKTRNKSKKTNRGQLTILDCKIKLKKIYKRIQHKN